jgi:RHS repeat-associated protein
VSFRNIGQQQWAPESDRHGELIQHCSPESPTDECFEFKSKDGTSYFYAYPSSEAPKPSTPDDQPTMLGLADGTIERVGLTDLRIKPPSAQTGSSGTSMRPSLIRRMQDRFGYQLVVTPDAEGRVGGLQEQDGPSGPSGRSCTLSYEPDPAVDCDDAATGFTRLRSITCLAGLASPVSGPLDLRVDYCYDKEGNLQEVRRGRSKERYEYEHEGGASPDAPNERGTPNLVATVVINEGKEQRTSYHYRDDVAPHVFTSPITPEPIDLFDMVDVVTYPPTFPMPGAEAEGRVEFGYQGDTRSVGDVRGAPHAGRTYTINTLGNPTKLVEEGVKTTTFEWSYDVGSSSCGTTPPGDNQLVSRTVQTDATHFATTSFAYDEEGNPTEECNLVGGQVLRVSQQFDSFGQVKSRTDYRGIHESWEYDPVDGFLKAHVDGAGVRTEYTPSTERRGKPATEKIIGDATQTTEYHYDDHGNVISSRIGGLATTETKSQFDARSRVERRWDQLKRQTTFEYDINDNLRFTYLPAVSHADSPNVLEKISTEYDDVGNKKSENDRNGLLLSYTYTLRNQLKTVTRTATGLNAGSHTKEYRYDLLGNIRNETDWKGNATVHEYDELGFRNKTTSREGLVQGSTHDYVGNVTFLTDSGVPPLTTEIHYDELNREIWRKPLCNAPDCGETRTEYPLSPDVAGPAGATVVYSIRRIIPGSQPGNMITQRTGYDGRNLMIVSEDGLAGHRAEWNYDALGRQIRRRNEEGVITTIGYDPRGFQNIEQIRGRSETARGLVTELAADDVGNVLFKTVWKDAQNTLVTGVTYDNWNRPITHTAPGSNTQEMGYDGEGNLVRSKDAGGRVRTQEFDQRGFLVRAYDAEVKSRTAGQFATAEDQAFSQFNQVIDANGHPEVTIDVLGVVTRHAYDKDERLKSVTEAEGTADARSREFREIDGIGNPHAVTDWKGNVTEITYTARHNVETEKDPLGRVTTYKYDGQGNAASVASPRPNTVRTFKHDDVGRVTDVYFPDTAHLESHVDYDNVGNPVRVKNRRNSVTHTQYDAYLRPEVVQKSLGDSGALTRVLTNVYDDASNVTAAIDARNNRTEFRFNARNLPWKTILPAVEGEGEDARTELRDYYDSGALRTLTAPHDSDDPSAYVVTYEYDKEDRVISTTAAGETTTQTYDLAGRLRATLLPEAQPGGKFEGKAKRFGYDKLGQVNQVTDEVNLITRFGHDKNGNLTDLLGPFLTDPTEDTPRVEYAYNEQVDRLQELRQFRKGRLPLVTAYDGFDEHDNVTHIVDPNGRGFTYHYDAFDRRIQAVYPHVASALNEPQQIDWDFDDDENVVKVTETKKPPTGPDVHDLTEEHFDKVFDRLASTKQRGFEVSYTYDDNGNRTSVTSPHGSTGYSFDERNRLETVTIGSAQTTYRYHQDGRARSITRGNGANTTFDYYPALRVKAIQHQYTDGGSAVVAYAYDHNGNRISVGDTRNGLPDVTTFDEYDAANRLVQFTQDGKVTRYGYERYNRHSENVKENGISRVNKTYAVDENERLTKVTDDVPAPAVAVDYSYDNNGNTLARAVSTAPADRMDFEYDSRDQLVRVTRGPPGSAETLGRYDYDSEGKRTRHLESERGAVDYLYDDTAVLEEHISANPGVDRTTRYHYGQELLAIAENAGTRYFHQDALGSTSALSDSAGVDVVDYKQDPFGNVRSTEGDDTDNRQTFTGQEYDERTALYYFGARYYDSTSGRFLTQDSHLGESGTPASLHRYLYAYSNPLTYVDPTGHDSENPVLAADRNAEEARKSAAADEAQSKDNASGGWGRLIWNSLGRGVKKGVVALYHLPGEVADTAVAFGTSALDHGLALAGVEDFKIKIQKQDEAAAEARRKGAKEIMAALFSTNIEECRSHSPGIATAIGVLAGDKRAVGDTITGVAQFGTETLGLWGVGKVAKIGLGAVSALVRAEPLVAAVEADAAAAGQLERSAVKARGPVAATRPLITKEAVAGRVEAAFESGAPGKSAAAASSEARGVSYWEGVTKPYAQAEQRAARAVAGAADGEAAAVQQRVRAAATSTVPSEAAAARGACSGGVCPCFVAGTPVDGASGARPIEQVALGDRVGPESAECGPSLDLSDWIEVGLRMIVSPDGAPDELDIRLLRPRTWLAEQGVRPGSYIGLAIDDLNVSGSAYVTYTQPVHELQAGTRCPVTGTVRHQSRAVINVALAEGEPLHVTAHHRLFSADRNDWVAAGSLEDGEWLQTRAGVVQVTHVDRTPQGPTEVFNLEVIGQHQYFVGDQRVRAHNNYGEGLRPNTAAHKAQRWADYQERGGSWKPDRWSNQYDVNMNNPKVGLGRERAYREALGAENRVLDTPFGHRQVDALVADRALAVQVKSGFESLTTTGRHANTLAIQKDAWLVKRGFEVEWVLEKGGSRPLLEALNNAGIKVHIGPAVK